MFELRDVPGKGKGLFATQLIRKGTRILSEAPIITVPGHYERSQAQSIYNDIEQQLTKAPDETRQAFFTLSNCHPCDDLPVELTHTAQALGILQTNAFGTRTDKVAVCIDASRFNHACDHNARHGWHEGFGTVTVHALTDIDQNEEITINYFGVGKTLKERQEYLLKMYKFVCTCKLCSLPQEQSEATDSKILRIRQLMEILRPNTDKYMNGLLANPLQMLRNLEEVVRHILDLGSGSAGTQDLSGLYSTTATLVITHSDLARGDVFMRRAQSVYVTEYGDDDRTATEYKEKLKDLSKLPYYKISTRWERSLNDVPHGLTPDQFDHWLWKKAGVATPREFADLRDRSTFLGIDGLPQKGLLDIEYQQNDSSGHSKPRRHWCFMGQILNWGVTPRLQLRTVDVDTQVVRVGFFTTIKPADMLSILSKGYTVVVLYAERDDSYDRKGPGVKVTEPSMVKIFPFSLQRMLELSDSIHKYATKLNDIQICHGCDGTGLSCLKCGKCKIFSYCSKDCQTKGWKEKKHKDACKMLEDPDMYALFTLKWHEYDGQVSFPLPSADSKIDKVVEGTSNMAL